ncbi:SprT-like family protein [Bradyrhizobium lablabi]|uniref:SprT-like family protein n=1 Tax=Bradyrhizobium lablabi TaxID=722472 RepID=A0A1M6LCP1_9BRAD|nr:SprT-like domain-containing protein [Bradyrhizobium lablabi]SHJ68957.1 SprT-like family protein [Bradyrhizobium lablabi]
MTLPLTAEMLEACYEFLRETKPFSDWNLPHGEDVKFIVGGALDCFAHYQWDGARHTITVSSKAVGYTGTLINVLSHEMVHLHLWANNMESKRSGPKFHNAAFRKFAAQVCKYHGFDPKAFY